MKTRVQAQHLQPSDIVGSGGIVKLVVLNSISWKSHQCLVSLEKDNRVRNSLWRKQTMINVERKDD